MCVCLLVLYLARVRVSQAYVAWVEEASAKISSIGSTCNIAMFPSVHAYVKGYKNFFERNCWANLLMHVSTGNESLSWGRDEITA